MPKLTPTPAPRKNTNQVAPARPPVPAPRTAAMLKSLPPPSALGNNNTLRPKIQVNEPLFRRAQPKGPAPTRAQVYNNMSEVEKSKLSNAERQSFEQAQREANVKRRAAGPPTTPAPTRNRHG
ncbi:MAG: hypothetical protein V4490_08320 [Pseudomonadota bacterium]